MNIQHFPISDTNKICKLLLDKNNIPIKYVCTTNIHTDNDAVDIFYRTIIQSPSDNRYFSLKITHNQIDIFDADNVEDLVFHVVEDDQGNLQYSQYLDDYKYFHNGNMICGGRSCPKYSGKIHTYKIKNGEMILHEYNYINPKINEFYTTNSIDVNFDADFYLEQHPEAKRFCKTDCIDNKIDDRQRLFYHYYLYNKNHKYLAAVNKTVKSYGVNLDFNHFYSKNLERIWPVADEYRAKYIERCEIGKKILKDSNVAIVSLARDCDKQLKHSIKTIQQLECAEFKFFIYENDSQDSTKTILENIEHPNIYKSINNHQQSYMQGISKERTTALATYRNICKQWITENYKNCDYVIVLDVDADLGFSINGIYNSVYWLREIKDSAGMASYSLYLKYSNTKIEFAHYDSFAVRLNDWQPTIDKDINNQWFRSLHPPVGSDPIPMYSCFGGLGIYKKDIFVSGHYDGSIGCEHVLFHKCLRDKGYKMYLNPSSRFFSVCREDKNDQ